MRPAPANDARGSAIRARAGRLPTGREAQRRATAADPAGRLSDLGGGIGNRALGHMLAGGRPTVGRADAAEERRADRVADAAVSDTSRPRRARTADRRPAGLSPGLGGGRQLPGWVRRKLGRHYDYDLRQVRLHTGPDVDRAATALGAQGFSYGRDVFLRGDRADPSTRSGLSVLSHELAHVGAARGGRAVLRRKTGLPTGAEAKTSTGKSSGAKGWFKGDWGAFRKLLDAYRATADDDTETQATLLLDLHAKARAIIDDKWRWSDAVKTYVKDRVPEIKLLYWEVAQKASTFDAIHTDAARLAPGHERLLDGQIRKGVGYIERAMKKARHAELAASGTAPKFARDVELEERPEAPTARRLIDRVKQAKVTVNFPPAALKWFIAESDFKQFWERRTDEDTSGGPRTGKIYAGQREQAEETMGYGSMMDDSGTVEDSQRAHRPIYAAINVFDNPRGAAPPYGRWHFELKDAVKARSTYSSGDSIDRLLYNAQGDARKRYYGAGDHLAPLLLQNESLFRALLMDEVGYDTFDDGRSTSIDAYKRGVVENYPEVQVHGGLSMNDVQCLVVDVPVPTSKDGLAEDSEAHQIWAWKERYKDIGATVRQA